MAPSAGLSLVARAVDGIKDAADLITDLSNLPPEAWPVAHHHLPPLPEPLPLPEVLAFPGLDLLALRREHDGTAKPQSPSRLENLLVSPVAWLLGEIGAVDMSWSAEELDVMAKGNISHHVFEHVFPPGDLLTAEALTGAVSEAYERALIHGTSFQFTRPDWSFALDVDQAMAAQTRKSVLDMAATDGLMVAGMHLDFPGFGYVERAGDAYRYTAAAYDYRA